MNRTSKVVCITVFLVSLLLIFAMGRTNVRNFTQVKDSIEGIYKDRLVVNGMIYRLATVLHKKEVAFINKDSQYFGEDNKSANLKIKEIIKGFKETYLTSLEEQTLLKFEEHVTKLMLVEDSMSKGDKSAQAFVQPPGYLKGLEGLKSDLETLAQIQLAEGKRKLAISERAVSKMELYQSVEDYSILIIGVLIVLIVLSPLPKDLEPEN